MKFPKFAILLHMVILLVLLIFISSSLVFARWPVLLNPLDRPWVVVFGLYTLAGVPLCVIAQISTLLPSLLKKFDSQNSIELHITATQFVAIAAIAGLIAIK